MNYDIVHADILEWSRTYAGEKFHAILCDPPYHLTQPQYRRSNWSPPQDTPFGRAKVGARGGFMSKEWDGGDIAFNPATWIELSRHLHPGAFILAFCGSRGWHRQAVAMEDAGLVMHPSCFFFGYAFGSGFPKATRIDTRIDQREGVFDQRQPTGEIRSRHGGGCGKSDKIQQLDPSHRETMIMGPVHPLAKAFAGHRYGLQAMKPAIEPILLFQKPYEGRPIDCIASTGAGALNIDGGRISPAQSDDYGRSASNSNGTINAHDGFDGKAFKIAERSGDYTSSIGRWPSNLILEDSDEVELAFPIQKSGSLNGRPRNPKIGGVYGNYENGDGCSHLPTIDASTGSASRFFFRVSQQLDEADPLFYTAKPGRKERDAGCEHMPLKATAMLNAMGDEPQGEIDPVSARFTTKARNAHPTVKALALTKYLATLLLPPKEFAPRRIIVPFLGSGSEAIGAMQAGWDEIVGIEKEAEYIPLAQARMKYWHDKQFGVKQEEFTEEDF